MRNNTIITLLAVSALALAGCSKDKKSSTPTDPTTGGLQARYSGANGIGTLFSQSCTSCHGATNPNGGYNLTTYAGTLDGGRIVPSDAANSLLVKKLEGAAGVGDRMPRGGPYLSTTEIDSIKAWINAGALNN